MNSLFLRSGGYGLAGAIRTCSKFSPLRTRPISGKPSTKVLGDAQTRNYTVDIHDEHPTLSAYLKDLGEITTASTPVAEQKLLQVAILGVPNAGKSTLINSLVGQKVTAVSPKTNTTVRCRLGAFTEGPSQVVLYDTPGIVGQEHYKNPRHVQRVETAWGTAGDCDMILFIVDVQRQLKMKDPRVLRLISNLKKSPLNSPDWSLPPSILVMNKLDMVPASDMASVQQLEEDILSLHQFEETFWLSAKRGRGVSDLRDFLLSQATSGEWTLEGGENTDASGIEIAQEIVREQIFLRYYAELPYDTQVVPVSYKTLSDGSIRVELQIVVSSENVKGIILGTKGSVIKIVGMAARKELEKIWGKTVHLILDVKVSRK